MASRFGFCKAISVVVLDYYSCKGAISSFLLTFRSDSMSDKFASPENITFALNRASIFASAKVQTPKYTEADLLRILKIFSEIKGQKTKAKILSKRFLKAKIPNMNFEKLYKNC